MVAFDLVLSAVGDGALGVGELLLVGGECWDLGDCPEVLGTGTTEASSSGSCCDAVARKKEIKCFIRTFA